MRRNQTELRGSSVISWLMALLYFSAGIVIWMFVIIKSIVLGLFGSHKPQHMQMEGKF